MKPLIVLAGGFGKRLRDIVVDVPKPLAPVSGKPFLSYLIYNWIDQGVSDFIFLLHHKHLLIEETLSNLKEDKALKDVNFKVIIEDKPLGTGGSVLNAIDVLSLTKSFLVINSDTWLSSGIKEINNSNINTIAAVKVDDCSRYGALEINEEKINRFFEKKVSNKPGYINAGLYHLSPEIFSAEDLGNSFSLEDKIFPKIAKIRELSVLKLDVDFIDIGIPSDYFRFCNWIEKECSFEL